MRSGNQRIRVETGDRSAGQAEGSYSRGQAESEEQEREVMSLKRRAGDSHEAEAMAIEAEAMTSEAEAIGNHVCHE